MKEINLQGGIEVCIPPFPHNYMADGLNARFSARLWTAGHGQFAVMGGFLLFKDGMPSQVLSPEKFTTLVDAGCIDFPSITERDIKAKGKAHPLLTFLTFLQTLWFITQCIVRRRSITLLEMMTLTFILMHALLLFFWWHKPLDARDAIRLNLIHIPPPSNPNPPDAHETNAGIKWDFSRENTLSKRVKVVLRSELPLGTRKKDTIPVRILKACLIAPINLFEKLFTDYGELFLRVETTLVPEGATETSLFYAPDTNNHLSPSLFVFENVLGFLFAFAHIVMLWYSHFPTHRDLVVWRISCTVSTGLPLLYIAGTCFLVAITAISISFMNRITDTILKAARVFAVIVITLGFAAMLVGRVTLIVEAFICLKALSGSSRLSVPWTNYIPHLS